MGKRKGRIVELFNKQSGICFYCREKMILELEGADKKMATIDHIIPKSVIGKSVRAFNEVAACFECNHKKADMPAVDFIMIMAKRDLTCGK